MTWYAMFPTTLSTGNGASCCIRSSTRSHTPTHSPFPQTGIVDPIDPQGWLYKLTGVEFGDPFEVLNPSEISSLWAPTSLGISYAGCFHTACNVTSSTVAAAQAVHSQANILATTTTTISSVGKTTSQAAAKQSATALPAAKPAPTTPLNPTPTPTKSPEPAPTSPAPKPDPQPSSPAPKDNPPPPASSPKVDSVPTTANTDKPPQNAGGSTSARAFP
ncbi:hypothetical protein EJ08DRAFT_201912 [Tothia fuscella]|uniref:Uncharacterized protein n=1 Tax=Tothia fuscella TaxID=1048955 RepID=A0A9P4TYP7_9PEZI|nr:hypothetical protein EJ08DRAFT_201912 [Tothia fuscella]